MWSNFTQTQQQAKPSSSSVLSTPRPRPPSPPQYQPPPASPSQPVEPHGSGDDDTEDDIDDADAWSDDDDILADELFDDVSVDDNGGAEDDEGGGASDNMAGGGVVVGGLGGGGWGSTALQSFASRKQQHEPLNLSSPPAAMAPPLPETVAAPTTTTLAATATAPAAAVTDDTETTSENQTADNGWDDDDLFDDSIVCETSPAKGTPPPSPPVLEETPTTASPIPNTSSNEHPTTPSTPLGRAADNFGAALLASVDHHQDDDDDDKDDEYSEGEYDDDDDGGHSSNDESGSECEGGGKVEIGGVARGGFGSGFVMKGLSRFIEAATAPQEDLDVESEEEGSEDDYALDEDGDGWGDDEDLDFQEEDIDVDENTDGGNNNDEGVGMDNVSGMEDNLEEANNESSQPPIIEDAAMNDSQIILKEEESAENEEPELEQEEEPTIDGAGGEGWEEEDIDTTFNTPQQKLQHHGIENFDSGKSSSTHGVSDSIKDFVAMTELNLDSEFNDVGMWQSPPLTNNRMGGMASSSLGLLSDREEDIGSVASSSDVCEFSGMGQVAVSGVEPSLSAAATTNGEVATKKTKYDDRKVDDDDNDGKAAEIVLATSLMEFVDNLDAELNDAIGDDITLDDNQQIAQTKSVTAQPATTTNKSVAVVVDGAYNKHGKESSYNYDENKDNSPEPMLQPASSSSAKIPPPPASLPHQTSWYINAMEGGRGGVVYGEEKALEAAAASNPSNNQPAAVPKGQIPIEEGVNDMSSYIAQCPSLPAGEPPSEIQSMGMPLSQMPSSNASPDGKEEENTKNTVDDADLKRSELRCEHLELIMPLPNNNEHELLKEQPGFGIKKLPDGTSVLVNYEKLLQNEATKRILLQRTVDAYKGTVQRLRDEKENLVNETQLFEAEIAAARNDKEYLESEMETERSFLEESTVEKTRLHVDQVEMLQRELEDVRDEKEVLRGERDALEEKVRDIVMSSNTPAAAAAAVEMNTTSCKTETLRSTIDSLQQELLEKDEKIEQLAGQHEETTSVAANQAVASKKASDETAALKSTVEYMKQDLLHKDGEIEQLTNQLRETTLTASQESKKASDDHDRLMTEFDHLENDFTATKSTLSRLQENNAASNETTETLRSTNTSLQQGMVEKDGEIENLKGELEEAALVAAGEAIASNKVSDETTALKSTVESMQQELLRKDGEIEQLANQLRETTLAASQASKMASDDHDRLMTEYDRSENDLSTTKSTLSRLQEDTAASNKATETLRSKIESLQQGLVDKDGEIENLKGELEETLVDQASKATEYDRLHNDFSETKSALAGFQDENETLCVKQWDNDVAISELKATVDAINCDHAGEVDKLTAEVASLAYELGAKSTQFEESVSVLQSLQTKLDKAEACLVEYNNSVSKEEERNKHHSNKEMEQSLRAEVAMLNKQIEDLQGACSLLKNEKASTIRNLEMQIQSLNAQCAHVAESSAVLQGELSHARKSLDEKVEQCEQSGAALQSLQAKLDLTEALHVEDNNDSSDTEQSLRAEIGLLKKQLEDLQGAYSLLEGQTFDLEKNLKERDSTNLSLDVQIQSLNAKVIKSSNLQDKLSTMRKSLDDKVHECQTISRSRAQLKTELLNTQSAQSDREFLAAKSQETAVQAREQISRLQSQIADLKDHNATMKNLEEQLTNTLQENTTLRAHGEEYRIKFEDAEKDCANITYSTSDTITKCMVQVSTLQGENLELSAALQTAQSALETKQLEVSRDNSEVKQLHMSIDAMKQEMDVIARHRQELLDKNHCLTQEKANTTHSLETRARTAEEQTNRLQRECDKLRSNIDSFQKATTDADQTVTILKEKVQAFKDKLQEKSDLVRSLKDRASTAEHQTNLLQLECAKLRSKLDICQKANADSKHHVTNLQEQLQALKYTNADLEDNIFEASFKTRETERLAGENASLRKERDELKKESLMLSQQINELASRADTLIANGNTLPAGALTSVEKESLLARINALEDELKAENLNELRDELTSMHEERQELDLDNEELLVQLGLIQQEKIENQTECEVEVEALREHVSTLQDQCKRLQNNLDEVRSNSTLLDEKEHVKILQEENNALDQTLSQLICENDSLKCDISDLTKKTEGLELRNNQVVKTLRQKLVSLELKLADKEEEVESTKKEIRLEMDMKDGEISKLKTECSSREKELKDMSSKLDATDIEMGSFSDKLEYLQSQCNQDQHNQTHCVAEEEKVYEDDDEASLQDLLAEVTLDSDDYLRSHIVVLAQALERSELQKADALERIFSERKSNEESLRQLGESVKRFYSTVRCSDAA